MTEGTAAREGGWLLRLARFPLVLLALLCAVLFYLYLAGYFFRASFTQGPLQGLAASAMSCATMLVAYAVLVHVLERRDARELAIAPMARELGAGLLPGSASTRSASSSWSVSAFTASTV